MTSSPAQIAVRETQWKNSFDQFVEFVTANDRLPGRGDSGRSEGRVNLNDWLKRARTQLGAGELNDDRKAALDAAWPGWEKVRKQNDVWSETLAELTVFVSRCGEPLRSSDDADERRLSLWLDRQRELGRWGLQKNRYARLEDTFSDWTYDRPQFEGYMEQGPMRLRNEDGESALFEVNPVYRIEFAGDDDDLEIAASGAVAHKQFRNGTEIRYVTDFSMSAGWFNDLALRAALRLPHLAVGLYASVSTRDGSPYLPGSPVARIVKL